MGTGSVASQGLSGPEGRQGLLPSLCTGDPTPGTSTRPSWRPARHPRGSEPARFSGPPEDGLVRVTARPQHLAPKLSPRGPEGTHRQEGVPGVLEDAVLRERVGHLVLENRAH